MGFAQEMAGPAAYSRASELPAEVCPAGPRSLPLRSLDLTSNLRAEKQRGPTAESRGLLGLRPP